MPCPVAQFLQLLMLIGKHSPDNHHQAHIPIQSTKSKGTTLGTKIEKKIHIKIQDMCPPKITSSIIMEVNENGLEELADKKFKRLIKIGFRKLRVKKKTEINEVRKLIHTMKTEFKKIQNY